MLKTVLIIEDLMNPSSWTTHETDDVCGFLTSYFPVWPATARLYHDPVCEVNDVTPTDEESIKKLQSLEGVFTVVVYPGVPALIVYIAVAIAVAAVAIVLLMPKVPNTTLRNTQASSPNNSLAERENKPRLRGRIPDIYGQVRSTPDLIAVPYTLYQAHQQVEYSYMCIGRGYYDVSDVRDDSTLIASIAGASVEVYAPNTSPNSSSTPQLRIGNAINTPVRSVLRSGSVNGQEMLSSNANSVTGASNISFVTPNQINSTAFDFTKKFQAGQTLNVYNASVSASYTTESQTITLYSATQIEFSVPGTTVPTQYAVGHELQLINAVFNDVQPDDPDYHGYNPGRHSYDLSGTYMITAASITGHVVRLTVSGTTSVWSSAASNIDLNDCSCTLKANDGTVLYNLNGDYTILSVTANQILLDDPASDNSAWSTLSSYPTLQLSPVLSISDQQWIGPFDIDKLKADYFIANFVATNGLYMDDGTNQSATNVTLVVEITPINADGTVRGAVQTESITVIGSSTSTAQRAASMYLPVTSPGYIRVRAYRSTPTNTSFKGTVVDEIKWADLYALANISATHFGNVTTVQSVTYATEGALSLKARKLNMLATRKIPRREVDGSFSTTLYASKNAADILCAMALDPFIGGRTLAELDVPNIYSTVAAVQSYFGYTGSGEFCHTFDSLNMSFEETVQTIAEAIFCNAYRQGNKLKLSFEKANTNSVLLFNHRNKLPGTEKRSTRFGPPNSYDGITYTYVDPDDDAVVTMSIPSDNSAVKPQEIESIGVRNHLQAYFHAWRAYQKLLYQNSNVQFDCTQEADMLVTMDRILVSDNTRPDTQDGQVVSQVGLALNLSQEVKFTGGVTYNIFLQLSNGTVQSIPITAGANTRQVILGSAPSIALVTDRTKYAQTTYNIVGSNESRSTAFLVTERESNGDLTSSVKAVNYDSRYYSKDLDWVNGLIDDHGRPV